MTKVKKVKINVEAVAMIRKPAVQWKSHCGSCDWESDCVPFDKLKGICPDCGEGCYWIPCS